MFLLAALQLASAAPVAAGARPSAQERSLAVEGFHAELVVGRSGTLHVREVVTFRFRGSWNGVYRSIPVRYRTPAGFDFRLGLRLESATLEDGTALRVEEEGRGGSRVFRIWVPDARDRVHTVRLDYRVTDALRFFETHDELYWNVTGTEWDVPVGQATARVILPEGVSGLRASAFAGVFGSQGAGAVVEMGGGGPGVVGAGGAGGAVGTGGAGAPAAGPESVNGRAAWVDVRTSSPLGFREGLTVVVGWDRGVVARPTRAQRTGRFLAANGFLALPLLSLLLMWRHWRARGRDPEVGPIAPVYRPPEGLTPGEVGTLVDNRPDVRDITATLVDLAIRGYLRIEEQEGGRISRLLGRQRFEFVRLRPRERWDALRPHEERVLAAVFESGAERVDTEALEHAFYKRIPGIRNALFQSLVGQGCYPHRPDRVVSRYVGLGVVVGGGLSVALLLLSRSLGTSPVTALAAGIGTAIPVVGFGAFMGVRTRQGVARLRQILGFQEFLDRVESDRYRRMIQGPEQFEAFLPHAMALGVEEGWARAFEGIYTEPPDWYRGQYRGGFSAVHLLGGMNDLTRHAGAAMTSAPRSSSGSSGFSGGSVGGGFGGGGGGGF
ncbi:MAG: DUF2207 domain-containing protein [Longimicrobiales bacterium]|nr:DUF2207 domain-containing protein [Longimicrobiales bacterium]